MSGVSLASRDQFVRVRSMPGQPAFGIAQIARGDWLDPRQAAIASRMTLRVLRLLWRLGGC